MWILKATIIGALIAIMNGQYVTDCSFCEGVCIPDPPYGLKCGCRNGFHFNPANLSACIPITNACQLGFYLNPATRTCDDLNECLNRPCEQVCTNQRGTFQCSCIQGFTPNPQNSRRCIATPCQQGLYRNPVTGICEAPTAACPQGYIRNPNTGVCDVTAAVCPPGYFRNPNTRICQATSTTAACPQGYFRNPNTGLCEATSTTAACQQGYFRNPNTGLCEATSTTTACPQGYFRNPNTGLCEATSTTAACPQGYFRNPNTGLCEATSTTAACPQGYFRNPNTGLCEVTSTTAACPQGYFRNPNTGLCEVRTSANTGVITSANTADRTPVCELGFYRNPRTGNCEAQPRNCPSGYVVNPRNTSTCSDINECQTSGLCEDKCINLNGGYRCDCFVGSQVSSADWSSCEPIRKCTDPKDVMFVIDSTTSIGNTNYKLQLSFISELTGHFGFGNSQTKFAALLYSDRVQKLFGFDDYRNLDDLNDAILAAPYLGGNMAADLPFDYIRVNDLFDTSNGGRSNVPKEVLFFADGPSTNPTLARAAAENLKNKGVNIIVIGIGPQVSTTELGSFASTPADLILVPGGWEYMNNHQQQVDRRLCPDNNN